MAGFFSLGAGRGEPADNNPPNQINPQAFFFCRNEDGYELWQGQARQHVNHQTHSPFQDLRPSSAGLDVGRGRGAIRISDEASGSEMRSGGEGAVSCQDCGNQAKRDCAYTRCRSCCKSRGFQCPTHVKSTWVPAARRRERQLQQQQQQQLAASQQHRDEQRLLQRENINRQRDKAAASSIVCTRLRSNASGMEVVNFPPEVSSQAVFQCVRVTSIDDNDDQYAYQTAVNIGGHVFKGILYDQGPETRYLPGESSSAGVAASATTTGAVAASSSAAVFLDPSLYSAPLGTFMPGTQFFPHPRS